MHSLILIKRKFQILTHQDACDVGAVLVKATGARIDLKDDSFPLSHVSAFTNLQLTENNRFKAHL